MNNSAHSAITLAAGRCLLFAYGKLQPDHRAPRSLGRLWPDRVRGRLFDLGRYPAAIDVGTAKNWVFGHVLEIAVSELVTDLDEFEEVAGGLYRRIRTTTQAGFEVWIYEYARPIPPDARGPIECWP